MVSCKMWHFWGLCGVSQMFWEVFSCGWLEFVVTLSPGIVLFLVIILFLISVESHCAHALLLYSHRLKRTHLQTSRAHCLLALPSFSLTTANSRCLSLSELVSIGRNLGNHKTHLGFFYPHSLKCQSLRPLVV